MMNILAIVGIIGGAITTILAIVGAIYFIKAYGKSHLGQDTIDLMAKNKKAQDDAIKRLEDLDLQKTQQISHLTGQVDLLKDIPLQKISTSMEKLASSHADLTAYMTNHDTTVKDATQKIIDHIDAMKGVQNV